MTTKQVASPKVYIFNPTCEYAVANGGKHWQPNKVLRKMEADLCTLPFILANPSDIVVVNRLPNEDYIKNLCKTEISPPQFECMEELMKKAEKKALTIERLLPWGWSPAIHHHLTPLKKYCTSDFLNSPVANWKHEYREIYSKKFALGILKQVLKEMNSEHFLPKKLLPEICTTQHDFERLLSRWVKLMVKAPWSSSGRGLQPVTKTPVHEKVWEKLMGIIHEQGFAIAEPYLDKVFDLAFQFEMVKGKINYLGTSYFQTDKKGQYKQNYLNGLPNEIGPKLKSFIEESAPGVIQSLKSNIENSQLSELYEGYFGVDALIFRNNKNELCMNPCLEINVRQNMGLLSLKIQNYLVHGRKGIFSIYYRPGKTFANFQQEMQEKYPLRLHENKIDSGFLALTPVFQDTLFGAYLLV